MLKKIHIILLAILFLLAPVYATDNNSPQIPQDSLAQSLFKSFSIKLDSAHIYTQTGQYEKAVPLYAAAFEEFKQFNQQRHIHDEKYLAELYETEQKEQHIVFLDETLPLRIQQNFLLVILCIISIVVLALLYFFLKYRLRNIWQKAEQKENETRLIELQKEERVLQTRLQTMEVERYQKELLAESLLINHKNKVLDDLRLFFVQNPELSSHKTELESILRPEPTTKEALAFETGVEEIHPVFYEHLQHRATNRLTPQDLEYCRMIYMKMTSKEMADILQVDPNTIRMGKYRLKQKLRLSKEEDLDAFIEKIG